MKIIRIPLLEDKYSINCIEISYDDLFLAFEGPENSIWIFKYSDIKNIIEYEPLDKKDIIDKEEEAKSEENNIKRKYWFNEPLNCQNKISIQEHRNSISALRFLHKDSHILFSSGFDKYIIIWKLDEKNMTSERMRKIPTRQEITDMKLYPNDKYLFVGFISGEINIYFCDYQNNSFNSIGSFYEHDDYLNSIVLSPNIMEDGLFASLSDKGKLILAEINIKNNDKINFKTKKVFPFENKNHFSKGDTKKIDWSPEGSMIISVDHQLIQDKKIIHARLIFLEDLENTQPLIGHVSSPLIAKFSKSNYIYDNEIFQLLVTCDRASNIKLWKVSNSTKKCSILFTNDDFSDSIIRDIIFSNDGKYLFIVSSFGSISIIVFDELQIINPQENNININNNNKINGKQKKKIIPQMISGFKPIMVQDTNNQNYNAQNENSKNIEGIFIDNESVNSNNQNIRNKNNSFNPNTRDFNNPLNPLYQFYQNIENTHLDYFNSISRHLNSLPSAQKKTFNFENIKSRDGYHLILSYENNIPFNMCSIILKLSNNYIIYIKRINSLIKVFTCSNTFYAFYDSRGTVNIFSLLGTPLYINNYIADVTTMDICDNFILIITNDNQIIVADFKLKKNIFSTKMLCLSSNNTYVMQKINNLYFLGINHIIVEITESSVYSNITKKKIMYFDCEKNEFILSENDNLSLNDKLKIEQKQNRESFYNTFIKELFFDYNVKYTENHYIMIDEKINDCYANFNNKINFENEKIIMALNLKNTCSVFANFDFVYKDFDLINQINYN